MNIYCLRNTAKNGEGNRWPDLLRLTVRADSCLLPARGRFIKELIKLKLQGPSLACTLLSSGGSWEPQRVQGGGKARVPSENISGKLLKKLQKKSTQIFKIPEPGSTTGLNLSPVPHPPHPISRFHTPFKLLSLNLTLSVSLLLFGGPVLVTEGQLGIKALVI